MRYAFIVNPVSGKGVKATGLVKKLEEEYISERDDVKYYLTEGLGDASVIANRLAAEAKAAGEEITIYACGGDGTVNEVVNGIMGYDNAVLGVVPIGSGNDYVRNFDDADFLDVDLQLEAKEVRVDVIRYAYERDGKEEVRYCANGMNIGFDGNTAIMASKLRKYPIIRGSMSYLLAIAVNMIKKSGANLRVVADGEEIYNGALLLCTISNGRFCGGGIESCPRAEIDNGTLELLIVSDVTRRKFIQVFGDFKVGKLFELPGVDEFAISATPKHVVVEPLDGEVQFVVDGEPMKTGTLNIDIVEGGLRVAVPLKILK